MLISYQYFSNTRNNGLDSWLVSRRLLTQLWCLHFVYSGVEEKKTHFGDFDTSLWINFLYLKLIFSDDRKLSQLIFGLEIVG